MLKQTQTSGNLYFINHTLQCASLIKPSEDSKHLNLSLLGLLAADTAVLHTDRKGVVFYVWSPHHYQLEISEGSMQSFS